MQVTVTVIESQCYLGEVVGSERKRVLRSEAVSGQNKRKIAESRSSSSLIHCRQCQSLLAAKMF